MVSFCGGLFGNSDSSASNKMSVNSIWMILESGPSQMALTGDMNFFLPTYMLILCLVLFKDQK